MSKVKQQLWNKLHAVKDLMKKKANILAQIFSLNAQSLATNYVPEPIRQSFGQLYSYTQPEREQPIALGQVSSFSDNEVETGAAKS